MVRCGGGRDKGCKPSSTKPSQVIVPLCRCTLCPSWGDFVLFFPYRPAGEKRGKAKLLMVMLWFAPIMNALGNGKSLEHVPSQYSEAERQRRQDSSTTSALTMR